MVLHIYQDIIKIRAKCLEGKNHANLPGSVGPTATMSN